MELRRNKNNLAVFDGNYRYLLEHIWNDDPILTWILLNPSTGNEFQLETTTSGCASRARKWGFGGIRVVNLFAFISTDPKGLNTDDPVGKDNDSYLLRVRNDPNLIAAWGRGGRFRNREQEVLKLLEGAKLQTLGFNKDGTPKHPLHMAHSIRPELWINSRNSI